MQRRTTQRSSFREPSTSVPQSAGNDEANEKNRGKIIRTQTLFGGLIVLVIALFCIGALLTPSQKHDLVEAEHLVEDWLQNKPNQTEPVPKQQPLPQNVRKTAVKKQTETKKEDKRVPPPQQKEKEKEDQPPKDDQHVLIPKKSTNLNRASSDAATARMEAQSSRWIDGEKALKKKLNVLFEQQEKGQNLGVPVLTRYLGEDIPAFVGTPDSTMKVEEWKKLVEAKYEEMRQEEEEWQKKMRLMIEKRTPDTGITTA